MNLKRSKLSISKKLLWIVLITGTLGTTFSTLLQIVFDYNFAKSEQQERIKLFERTAIPSLEEVVWNINERALRSLLATTITNRDYAGIRVLNEQNVILDQQTKNFEFSSLNERSFELHNPHQPTEIIGYVKLTYTTDFIVQDLKRKMMTIIFTNLFKTIFVSVLLLFLFRIHFAERLKHLADRLKSEDWSNPKSIVSESLPWPYHATTDEIHDLELALNQSFTIIKNQNERLIDAATSSARLAELGIFAAGIAHEINNPLTIILGTTERIDRTLKSPAPKTEETTKGLETIRRSALRVSQIIAGIKSLARDGSHDEFKTISINDLAAEISGTFDIALRAKNIQFKIVNQAPATTFFGRFVQISQVLLNLINNAIDAIATQDNPWIQVEFQKEDQQLIIRVTDSGKGIPENLREKLFVPFFTTKEVGKGTGLGLSIVAGIIKNHGGTIEINNKSPNTQFVIHLPIKQEETRVA